MKIWCIYCEEFIEESSMEHHLSFHYQNYGNLNAPIENFISVKSYEDRCRQIGCFETVI